MALLQDLRFLYPAVSVAFKQAAHKTSLSELKPTDFFPVSRLLSQSLPVISAPVSLTVSMPFRDEIQAEAGKNNPDFDSRALLCIKRSLPFCREFHIPFELGSNTLPPKASSTEVSFKPSFLHQFQKDMSYLSRLSSSIPKASTIEPSSYRVLVLGSKNSEANARLSQNFVSLAKYFFTEHGIKLHPFFLTYACDAYSEKNSKMTPKEALHSVKLGWDLVCHSTSEMGYLPPLGVYVSGPLGVYPEVREQKGLAHTLSTTAAVCSFISTLSDSPTIAFGDTTGMGTAGAFLSLMDRLSPLRFKPEFHLHHNQRLTMDTDFIRLITIISKLSEASFGHFHIGTGSGGSPFSKGGTTGGLGCNLLGELPLLFALSSGSSVNAITAPLSRIDLFSKYLSLSLQHGFRSIDFHEECLLRAVHAFHRLEPKNQHV